jgi:hypothetical protein
MAVILTAKEAETRKMVVQSQPKQIVCKTLSQKTPLRKRVVVQVQGISPEFKTQYCKKKKRYVSSIPSFIRVFIM